MTKETSGLGSDRVGGGSHAVRVHLCRLIGVWRRLVAAARPAPDTASPPLVPAQPAGLESLSVDELVSIASYFRVAMESRRAISRWAFAALVGLDLLLIKGLLDEKAAITALNSSAYGESILVAQIGIIGALVLYLLTAIEIELVNWWDRESYLTAQDEMRARLLVIPRRVQPVRQRWWLALLSSWASTWPGVGAIGMTIASVFFLNVMR